MTKKRGEIQVEESGGNVFADLGLREPEERLAKADLAIAISREIDSRGLTQTEAAELLGVAQPEVSNLMRGRLAGYSIERLTRLLNALGQDVEIRIRPSRTAGERGHLRVAVGWILDGGPRSHEEPKNGGRRDDPPLKVASAVCSG
jgi:predicted XRE-type DNA-binding protein